MAATRSADIAQSKPRASVTWIWFCLGFLGVGVRGFRVQGLGFRGLGVQSLGFRVRVSSFQVESKKRKVR